MKLPSEIQITLNINATIRFVRHVTKPGPLSIQGISEMADQIRLQVNSSADPDTETREVTVTVEGAEPVVLTYPISAPESFLVTQGAAFSLSVVDIDDSGNRSEATTGSFVAQDTFAPAAPGSLTVEAIGEE